MMVLKRMQQPVVGLGVKAHATRSAEHPTVLKDISLEFLVNGEGVDPLAVSRALRVSEERLCPVWNMLKASTPITASFNMERQAAPAAVHPL
jgi:putative redox protein